MPVPAPEWVPEVVWHAYAASRGAPMCGIAACYQLSPDPSRDLRPTLAVMQELLRHRGPDGEGFWLRDEGNVGFAHVRLAILDPDAGPQPMIDEGGTCIVHNGEVYNYLELRREIGTECFRTRTDTEAILRTYRRYGERCVDRLRGMFAFAIWDEQKKRLFCARDRFGIKPLYYTVVDGLLLVASEAKALLPFLPTIEIDTEALQEYLTFQYPLHGRTLFGGVQEVPPGHVLVASDGHFELRKYWEIQFEPDFEHTERWFHQRLEELFDESMEMHLRSDVPVGAYVSGGVDSGIVAAAAAGKAEGPIQGFTGRFDLGAAYDESPHARAIADQSGIDLSILTISPDDLVRALGRVAYHMDYPVAGPGALPQFLVSELASKHVKVVLGGQGGDEIFGGYVRYLVAYFEQCIKAAIDGTMHNGNFVVTYESIIPNLGALREYRPMLREFWSQELFEEVDRRYFRLVNRATTMGAAIDWDVFADFSPFEAFQRIFKAGNVRQESYFDAMTHYDFRTLLPALLHVEDRMSMAHGLEARVPFLDDRLVQFAATMPANVKFKDGRLKHALREALGHRIPSSVLNRRDKMGFPVPLQEWARGDMNDAIVDILGSERARSRAYLTPGFDPVSLVDDSTPAGRGLWGILSLELWQQEFIDRNGGESRWRQVAEGVTAPVANQVEVV